MKLASGKSDNHTELHVGGNIIGSDYKNKITPGNYTELSGEVYGNEWDVYSFDCNDSGCKELNLSDFAPDGQTEFELYRHNENGTFDTLSIDDWSETITGLDGRYSLLVHVEDADFKKDGENDYSFTCLNSSLSPHNSENLHSFRDFCVFFKTGRRDEVEKLKKHTTVTHQPGHRQAGISINFNQVR